MNSNESGRKKIAEQKITGFDYTSICFGCKCHLKTQKERDQNYCEPCRARYLDKYDAMHGDNGRTHYKQTKKS